MEQDIRSIAAQFRLEGRLVDAEPFGSGHINDTYALTCEAAAGRRRYVLQRINHLVFTNPPAVMENIRRVTEHIRTRLAAEGSPLAARQLVLIETHDGRTHFQDALGNTWRVYNRVEDAMTYDTLQSPAMAREVARMFGWFGRMLTDLPGGPVHETIVGFHDTPKRLAAFMEVLRRDPQNRAAGCRAEIAFVEQHAAICGDLLDLVDRGEIPVRTTHNDTKVNNVMMDVSTQTGVCVVDLDTVMPGLSLYDFGDMVRTATCEAAEDEQDLSKVRMRMPMFEALVRGYAAETHGFLTSAEKKRLAFSGKLITFEQMIRFLADHLAGDVYYRIHRPGQNLDRARTQMKLVQSIIEQEDAMTAIADSVFAQYA